jgi:hypothetical protein
MKNPYTETVSYVYSTDVENLHFRYLKKLVSCMLSCYIVVLRLPEWDWKIALTGQTNTIWM